MMAKGAIEWLVVAICGLLLILFLSFLYPKVYGSILDILEQFGLAEQSNITKAVRCSYYLCNYGCLSAYVRSEQLNWKEPDPNNPQETITRNCYDEFCNIPPDRYTDPNKLTICQGFYDNSYAVNITLGGKEHISRSDLTELQITCLAKNVERYNILDVVLGFFIYTSQLRSTLIGGNYLLFSESVVDTTGKPVPAGSVITPSPCDSTFAGQYFEGYEDLYLKPGTIYLSAIHSFTKFFIVGSDSPPKASTTLPACDRCVKSQTPCQCAGTICSGGEFCCSIMSSCFSTESECKALPVCQG